MLQNYSFVHSFYGFFSHTTVTQTLFSFFSLWLSTFLSLYFVSGWLGFYLRQLDTDQ